MTVLTNALVLSLQKIKANTGKICYQTIVTPSTISATSYKTFGATSFPPSNMANPATAWGWEAASVADQTISIVNSAASEIDYVGIARHNLNQPGLEIQIRFNGVVVQAYGAVAGTQALLFLFETASPSLIQIDIRGAGSPAKIAVIYAGKSLDLQRSIYVGHTPINYGRQRTVVNGISQAGEYLGQVVLNESLTNTVNLQNLTPDWYRQFLDPFISQNPRAPCFYAWRPGKYPAEVGYCWIEGDPVPENQSSNGFMSISWTFRGIA